MSSKANNVGTPHDKANADWMLSRFKEWGWDARIETFYVLYPTPHGGEAGAARRPPLTPPSCMSPASPATPRRGRRRTCLPPYLAYQGDGDVTAELVYANYGMPEDYIDAGARRHRREAARSSSPATAAAGAG